ncbi:MAG: ribonuclease III [Anaerolineales bacterium]|nr:ribonuclease III [Anaerolineales bacterium]
MELETALGITFKDKSLLTRALTHRSYLNENSDLPYLDNERLEFLGDAILDFVAAEFLYQRFPEMPEGDLTSLRAALVKGDTLARFAIDLGLPQYLLMSRGEEAARGRERAPLLAGAFEALIGALYLDRGLAAAREFVLRFLPGESERVHAHRLDRDAKSMLQELSQGKLQVTPLYRLVETRGPDHAKDFTIAVILNDIEYGRGTGRSKQIAEQEAACVALENLQAEVSREDHAALIALRGEVDESRQPTTE